MDGNSKHVNDRFILLQEYENAAAPSTICHENSPVETWIWTATIILFAVIFAVCNSAALQDSSRRIIKEEALQEPTNPPIPYNFEFDSRDQNGTMLFRKESKDGSGKVEGRYGYKDMHGIERIVEYVADKDGYRAKIRTNEPGIDRRNSAGVEFYADTSNRHVQIAKKQGENLAAVSYKPETTTEERKNLIAEKIDAEIANQYSGVLSHPSELRSQHHLFPQKQTDLLRVNQNAPLNSVQFDQSREIPSTPSNENNAIPQPLHYAQQFSTAAGGRQQFQILNSQVAPIQYVSAERQPQVIPAPRQLVSIPLNQLYIPQNQQNIVVPNSALSSTTQVQTLASQVIPPQPFYSLASHSQTQQGGLVTVPLSYAQAPAKGTEYVTPQSYAQAPTKGTEYVTPLSYAQAPSRGTEYIPLGRRISGLSEYFQ